MKGYQPTAKGEPTGTPPSTGTGVTPRQRAKLRPAPIYVLHHKDWTPLLYQDRDEAMDAVSERGGPYRVSLYLGGNPSRAEPTPLAGPMADVTPPDDVLSIPAELVSAVGGPKEAKRILAEHSRVAAWTPEAVRHRMAEEEGVCATACDECQDSYEAKVHELEKALLAETARADEAEGQWERLDKLLATARQELEFSNENYARSISDTKRARARAVKTLPRDTSELGWTIDKDAIEQVLEAAAEQRGHYSAEQAEEIMLAMVRLGYARLEAPDAPEAPDAHED